MLTTAWKQAGEDFYYHWIIAENFSQEKFFDSIKFEDALLELLGEFFQWAFVICLQELELVINVPTNRQTDLVLVIVD